MTALSHKAVIKLGSICDVTVRVNNNVLHYYIGPYSTWSFRQRVDTYVNKSGSANNMRFWTNMNILQLKTMLYNSSFFYDASV